MKELIETLLKEKKYFEIKKQLNELNAVEISDILNQFKIPELVIMIFRLLKKDKAADVFPYLDSEHQEMIIHTSTDIETREIFDKLYFDDIVDIIEEMPSDVVKKILKNTDKKDRHLINQLLKYPDNSAGSIMTTEYVDFQKNMTVSEAIELLRKTGKDKENIYTCYVTSENGKLEGVLSLKELIAKKDNIAIEDIMNKNFISVHTDDDQEVVADLFKKYDFIVMPVVDHEGRILGIITIDDVMDVVDQEVTEDFHKMAGITSPTDDSYLKTNIFTMAYVTVSASHILAESLLLLTKIITPRSLFSEVFSTEMFILLMSFIFAFAVSAFSPDSIFSTNPDCAPNIGADCA